MIHTVWFIDEEIKRSGRCSEWVRFCTPEYEKETRGAMKRIRAEYPEASFRIVKTTREVMEEI